MHTTLILNAEAGYNTEIVMTTELSLKAQTALVAVNGTLTLMRVFPKCDPTDTLLPESVIDAGVDYARHTLPGFKIWAVGALHFKGDDVVLGKTVVGNVVNERIVLSDIQTLIKRYFH